VADFKAESEKAARGIKDRVEAARIKRATDNQAAELGRRSAKLRQKAGQETNLAETHASGEEIHEGDRVRIQSLDRDGIVESIRDGIYGVMVGPLRYRADRKDIEKIGGSLPQVPPPQLRILTPDNPEETVRELKVIGLSADEALDRVDKFLDQAFLADIDSVRIIHGHGKGILRKAIAAMLAGHPQVERFNLATPDKGGSGATMVELKK
jgi:DNA mismatch repair protein MutS2